MRNALAVLVIVGLLAAAASAGSPSGSTSCGPAREFRGDAPELVIEPAQVAWSMTMDEATFSSPRVFDLTGDGVLDIVQGFGQDTLGARESSVIATNGATGEQLWRSRGHDDLIGSAVFVQLGGDDTLDVVIGGRRGELIALDGEDGSLLWEFDDRTRWFNFYTLQVLPDQNGDGIGELLAANGGLVFNEPEEGGGLPDPNERHQGYVFVLSGADGSVISSVSVPDRGESYMSPVLVPVDNATPNVLVGTGGETLPGSLWQMPFDALMAKKSDAALRLESGRNKGIIASPIVADLTGDCVSDVVVQAFDGTVSLVDGASHERVWAVSNPGFETYSTPALGYFVGDDQIPDVFASVALGVWPEYESSDYLLIDGATGLVVWRETLGTFAPSGFAGADINGDGRDEAIFGVNDPQADTQQLYVLDPSRGEAHGLGDALEQTTFSAPWLGDLDSDGFLDLIVTQSSYQPPTQPAVISRFVLGWVAPEYISWGGYLGTSGTGLLVPAEAAQQGRRN